MVTKFIKHHWQKPGIRQFTKFVIIGFSNMMIDFFVYFLLTRSINWLQENYLIANVCSFSVAVTWSFFWNTRWTFKNQNNGTVHSRYIKFFVISAMGLLWAELILFVSVDYFGLMDILGKLLAVFLVTFWNFFFNRWWTFSKKENVV